MKVQVEELTPIEKKLSITVDAKAVADELNQAYATLSRQVKIAGFRAGKIPRHILEQRFRADVEQDVVGRITARAYVDAVKQHKVEVVGDPQVQGGKFDPKSPYSFTASVEVKPQLTAKDYKGLKLTKRDLEVTDAQVEERVQQLRDRYSEFKDLDRALKQGDFAVIDFDATCDGKEFPGSKATGITVEVTPGELIEGNIPQLEGVKAGETKDFDYAFPSDYRVDEVKGKTARFHVTVKQAQERKPADLTDEFCEKLKMGAHTVAELKARLRKDLERSTRSKVQFDDRDEIFKALIEKNPFDLPKSMLERGIDMLMDGALRSVMRAGVDPRALGMDLQGLRNDMKPRAEAEVRGQLLLEAVAKQESIAATEEDLEKKLEEIAEETGSPLSSVRKELKKGEAREGLEHRIKEEKTIAFLKSVATFS